jgi:hypothetical protein
MTNRGAPFDDYPMPGMKSETAIFPGGGARAPWLKHPVANTPAVIQTL